MSVPGNVRCRHDGVVVRVELRDDNAGSDADQHEILCMVRRADAAGDDYRRSLEEHGKKQCVQR
jgi:hypothetical protein